MRVYLSLLNRHFSASVAARFSFGMYAAADDDDPAGRISAVAWPGGPSSAFWLGARRARPAGGDVGCPNNTGRPPSCLLARGGRLTGQRLRIPFTV